VAAEEKISLIDFWWPILKPGRKRKHVRAMQLSLSAPSMNLRTLTEPVVFVLKKLESGGMHMLPEGFGLLDRE
jgi:hypothetical protein